MKQLEEHNKVNQLLKSHFSSNLQTWEGKSKSDGKGAKKAAAGGSKDQGKKNSNKKSKQGTKIALANS